MKKSFIILAAALALYSCQESQKIAFVDNGKVINEYQAKIDLEEKYKTKDQAFQKRRDSLVNIFQEELKDAQERSKKMSQANLQKLSLEFQQKEQMLSQRIQMEQQQMQQEFQTEIDSAIVNVKNFIKDYGKTNGYTFILGTSDASASVLYGEASKDLSETILKDLNEAYTKE